MTRLRAFQLFSIVMVFLNLVLLAIVAFGALRTVDPLPRQLGGLQDRIANELQLDANQRAAYRASRQIHQQEMRQLNDAHTRLVLDYFRAAIMDEDTGSAQALLSQIGASEQAKVSATTAHFLTLKHLCTEEQLVHFPEVIRGAIDQMHLRPQKRRPPPKGQ